MSPRMLVALLAVPALASIAAAGEKDPLPGVKARMKLEAQRVEKEFAEDRAAAYKLVRRDEPRLLDATKKLQSLLSMVRADKSLDSKRREVLLVTLKWDLGKVKEIADERRKSSRAANALTRELKKDNSADSRARASETGKRRVTSAKDIADSRAKSIADARLDRITKSDRSSRVMRDVERSAIPDSKSIRFPKNWVELSKRRSAGVKMTAKEKAIMKALNTSYSVDYSSNTFEDIIDSLQKSMKVSIQTDSRGMKEAGVTSETTATLKLKASGRTVLKRLLGDLGLAYVVKDETILITSAERAKQMTTTRTYYIGDLASVVDVRIPFILQQAAMYEKVSQIITLIMNNVDSRSWKVNNPDAPGTIVFNPLNMSLIVKQTAEIHFMLGGK